MADRCAVVTETVEEAMVLRELLRARRGVLAGGGGVLEWRMRSGQADTLTRVHRETLAVVTVTAEERAAV